MRGLIHHVEIYVSDLDRTRHFWSWLLSELGYELFQEWSEGFSYKLGETYLVFVQTEAKYLEQPFHRCATGLNHIAFHLDSEQEIDEFTEKLRLREIPILYEDRHPYAGGENYYAVYFEDPDRLKVEIALSTPEDTF
jgi:catechol 2,3-dioxygenase-like lactoylglutathione lyase family enzyme